MNIVKEYIPVVALTFGLVYILRSVVLLDNGAGGTNGY